MAGFSPNGNSIFFIQLYVLMKLSFFYYNTIKVTCYITANNVFLGNWPPREHEEVRCGLSFGCTQICVGQIRAAIMCGG